MNGALKTGEYHPMADSAMQYIKRNMTALHQECIASTALSGNRCAEICMGTINRLEKGEPVSDRYLLGLAWMVRELVDSKV